MNMTHDKMETLAYATRVLDKDIVKKSSSGGMFVPLSDYILEQDGAIACAVYNYAEHRAAYELVFTKTDRDKAIGSKYMQSELDNIFNECLEWLKKYHNRPLLFIGMGCQADGFRRFLELNNLKHRCFVVDIICHGSPSQAIWHDYARYLEKKYQGEIQYLTFKDKRNGWKRPYAFVRINSIEVNIKKYVKIFYNRCALRPACYKCPYTTPVRNVDMTIGDFWGIEDVMPDFYSEEGNSLVLVHTKKGEELFEKTKNRMEYQAIGLEECLQPNLIRPTIKSLERERFWEMYRTQSFVKLLNKYGTDNIAQKIKRIIVQKFGGGVLNYNSINLIYHPVYMEIGV